MKLTLALSSLSVACASRTSHTGVLRVTDMRLQIVFRDAVDVVQKTFISTMLAICRAFLAGEIVGPASETSRTASEKKAPSNTMAVP